MVSDGAGSAGGGDGGAGEIKGGFGGATPEAGAGAAGEDVTLDADDGADEGGPLGVGEGVGGIKDGDAALLLPVTSAIAAADAGERCGAGAEVLCLLMQGWLSLSCMIRSIWTSAPASNVFFGNAGHRA